MDATELLSEIRIVPVVTLDDPDLAVPLAEALVSAGIHAIEVTLRSDAALEAMRRISREVSGILLGAGSVRKPEHFGEIAEAGCHFAVSPGATEALLARATLPYLPGASSASESMRLYEAGYRLQKFFPAEASGGIAALSALAQPLPEISFCPTGGITEASAPDYLALSNVSCIGGSWFVSKEKLANQDFDSIRTQARRALSLI